MVSRFVGGFEMNDEAKIRKKFEDWAASEETPSSAERMLQRSKDGVYSLITLQLQWQGFQAGYAACQARENAE